MRRRAYGWLMAAVVCVCVCVGVVGGYYFHVAFPLTTPFDVYHNVMVEIGAETGAERR